MKIKKNDKVIVIAGKDKGKTGVVEKVMKSENRVVISGVNVRKVHKKPTRSGQKGQIVEVSMAINSSNVMLVDPKNGKPTRVGLKKVDGKKVRFSKKSSEII
jgi:large subunit ribosomal protein L24